MRRTTPATARLRAGLALAAVLLGSVLLDRPPAAQAPDRSRPPALGPTPALHLPAVQKRRLANGLAVWIVEEHEVPVAQVTLVSPTGADADPPGRFGATSMMAAMLPQGAGSRSALEIADAIDYLGADLGAGATFDATALHLHVPVARLADALPIMSDVALRPTFPPEELERLRRERLTTLLQARDDPPTIAAQAFAHVVYGPAHRYGAPLMGTAETIKAFTPADLRARYAAVFRPAACTLLVVGDVSPDRVMPLLESSFGRWTAEGPAPAAAALPPAGRPARRAVYIVDKPDAPQTQIRIGSIGAARSTPDYFAIQVMNTILGGSFTSRLNLNLREKHGYTYGASSAFDLRKWPGPFAAGAGVQTDKTADALKEFFNELNGILQPVPAPELSRAKNYISLRFPAAFETTADISRQLEDTVVHQLPDDYFATYVQRIEAVSAADVQRVARKYIEPSQAAVVLVGDRKAIEPGVAALGLGPIRSLAIDEVFGPPPAP